MSDRYRFECENCGSSVELDAAKLDPIEATEGDYSKAVLCGDHSTPRQMRRVD